MANYLHKYTATCVRESVFVCSFIHYIAWAPPLNPHPLSPLSSPFSPHVEPLSPILLTSNAKSRFRGGDIVYLSDDMGYGEGTV